MKVLTRREERVWLSALVANQPHAFRPLVDTKPSEAPYWAASAVMFLRGEQGPKQEDVDAMLAHMRERFARDALRQRTRPKRSWTWVKRRAVIDATATRSGDGSFERPFASAQEALENAGMDLVSPTGEVCATVWRTGYWHTWDLHGIGGENGVENSVREASEQAVLALHRQACAQPSLFLTPMPQLPVMLTEVV